VSSHFLWLPSVQATSVGGPRFRVLSPSPLS
jgi:hypothetical protein